MPVTLVPVGSGDEPFLQRLYATTRGEELTAWGWDQVQQAAFLQMQYRAQRLSYQQAYPGADHALIIHQGQPVGRLLVHRGTAEIRLVDIALLPAWRGQGLGTTLLTQLKAEAAETDRPIRLHVLQGSPAESLYRRLGFGPVDQHGPYLAMEWVKWATSSLA